MTSDEAVTTSTVDSTDSADDLEQTLAKLQNVDLVLICGVAQLFGVVLAVIYSGDTHDIWDILIAGFVLSIYKKYKKLFNKDNQSLLISQLGVSIAYMIIIMTLFSLLWPIIASYAVIYDIVSIEAVRMFNSIEAV